MSAEDQGEPSGASLSYRNILEREMENALKEIGRPPKGVFLPGSSAGLNLSFGALFVAMVLTFSGGFGSKLLQQFVLAGVSSVAFLFVVVGPAMGIVASPRSKRSPPPCSRCRGGRSWPAASSPAGRWGSPPGSPPRAATRPGASCSS